MKKYKITLALRDFQDIVNANTEEEAMAQLHTTLDSGALPLTTSQVRDIISVEEVKD